MTTVMEERVLVRLNGNYAWPKCNGSGPNANGQIKIYEGDQLSNYMAQHGYHAVDTETLKGFKVMLSKGEHGTLLIEKWIEHGHGHFLTFIYMAGRYHLIFKKAEKRAFMLDYPPTEYGNPCDVEFDLRLDGKIEILLPMNLRPDPIKKLQDAIATLRTAQEENEISFGKVAIASEKVSELFRQSFLTLPETTRIRLIEQLRFPDRERSGS